MDIQREREALIAEIERFKEEAMKSYVVSCWAESYTNTDPFGYVILENENNKVWWLKTQAYQLWEMWQAAKAQAIPDGFVVVPKEPTFRMSFAYQMNSVAPISCLSVSGYKAMIEAAQEPAND